MKVKKEEVKLSTGKSNKEKKLVKNMFTNKNRKG
jgi:hypothetical protein